MPTNIKSMPAKKLIDASIPTNISAEEKKKLEDSWNEKAREREAAVAHETKIPDVASVTLTYQVKKFGKYWVSYAKNDKGRWAPLMPAPSIPDTAQDLLLDRMADDMIKS
jgi:hypothetical protein